jgi:glucokinase
MVTMGAVAIEPFEAVGIWLGYGIADLAAILDPRVFIIGGGVSEAGELPAGPARETFQANLTAHGHRPRGRARPGEAGLNGAADLARR